MSRWVIAAALVWSGCVADTLELVPVELPVDPVDEVCTDCEEIEARLDGLRWELPCFVHDYPEVCTCERAATVDTELAGEPGRIYDVELRFRGVVEEKKYEGGRQIGPHVVVDPDFVDAGDPWNSYALEISDPAGAYYLNHGDSGLYYSVGIDYVVTVPMAAGASVRLTANAYDARQITNLDAAKTPILVPGVAPYPEPFDGQFIEMTVVGLR